MQANTKEEILAVFCGTNTHTLSHNRRLSIEHLEPRTWYHVCITSLQAKCFFFYFSGACLPKVSNYQMQILHNNCWCVCVASRIIEIKIKIRKTNISLMVTSSSVRFGEIYLVSKICSCRLVLYNNRLLIKKSI